MKAVGIVAEYNPFHYGHKYQIETSVRQSLADVVVVAMSGNFVQRGEPAICDKWKRATMALKNGADLVIEIPTYFCLNNAREYANAAIELFKGLGYIDLISFGSESGNIEIIREAGKFLDEKKTEIDEKIKALTISGYSFPRARQRTFEAMGASQEIINIISSPNDTLGMEYVRSWGYNPVICVKRNEDSAKRVRYALSKGKYEQGMLPKPTEEILFADASPEEFLKLLKLRDERAFELARFAILRDEAEHIENMPQAGEGLAHKLKKEALKAKNLEELIHSTKSKRYTYTRISRLIYQIMIDLERNINAAPRYIRVLGFTAKGRELLSDAKKTNFNTLPIITNLNRYENKEDLKSDIKSTEVYNLLNGFDLEKNHELKRTPIIM